MKKIVKGLAVVALLGALVGCTATVTPGGGGGYLHCHRWCHNGWCTRHCWRN